MPRRPFVARPASADHAVQIAERLPGGACQPAALIAVEAGLASANSMIFAVLIRAMRPAAMWVSEPRLRAE